MVIYNGDHHRYQVVFSQGMWRNCSVQYLFTSPLSCLFRCYRTPLSRTVYGNSIGLMYAIASHIPVLLSGWLFDFLSSMLFCFEKNKRRKTYGPYLIRLAYLKYTFTTMEKISNLFKRQPIIYHGEKTPNDHILNAIVQQRYAFAIAYSKWNIYNITIAYYLILASIQYHTIKIILSYAIWAI